MPIPMADYEHHIFLSHRRSNPDTVRWTRECFLRPLRSQLGQAIPGLSIFFDEQIDQGASWPDALASAHARSRILVPVLSPDYFASDWCRLELALMCERERRLGYRTAADPRSLIFPVVINDGDRFPPDIRAIQNHPLQAHSNIDIQPKSPEQTALTESIRLWSESLITPLENPPPCDDAWATIAHDQFRDTFRIHTGVQTTVPSLTSIILPP
jgi:hypothetical protein